MGNDSQLGSGFAVALQPNRRGAGILPPDFPDPEAETQQALLGAKPGTS